MEGYDINLDSFKNNSPLIKATIDFFEQLNIYVTPVTEQVSVDAKKFLDSQNIQNKTLNDFLGPDGKCLETYFVGMLNNKSLYKDDDHGNATLDDEIKNAKDQAQLSLNEYSSLMIFAVEAKDDPNKPLTKSEISMVCRAFNRAFAEGNPVVVMFRSGDRLTFSLCERTDYRRATFRGQKAGKVSMLRNISIQKPHSGHLRILLKIKQYKEKSKSKVITFNDLYLYWLNEVFAVNVLTDDFYREISEWYEWVTDCESKTPKPIIQFPDMLGDTSIDEKQRIVKEHALRLITRLMFVWFCKQKNLVADELFDVEELKKSIVDFDFGIEDKSKLNIREFDPDDEKSSVYYNAILQNLFFATINTKINEREWAEQTQVDGKPFHSVNQRFKTVWRDNNQQSFFIGGYKKEQAQKIASYFNQSPFLNGGLFAPLDRREPIEDAKTGLYKLKYNGEIEYSKVIYHDGFSRDNKAHHRAFVPNCAIIGKSGSNIGLINIFQKYYFTVEENTPIEVDVALDPELLGNVFENLIGLYNPETHDIVQKAKQEAQRNRRKATGSFYTPKEIVQYMTQSSVVQYLVKETGYDFQDIETLVKDDYLPDAFLTNPDKKDEGVKPEVAETISDAIIKCKILDPACGSGAFPMGCLQILNSILARIDNDNKVWQNTIIKITKEENSKNNTLDFEKFKKEQDRINTAFLYSSKFPGYFRKLYLLEHCIYGVDIQRIAMQITKLRFFIALVAECEATNNIEQNYGMHALPNLETKFVCANTLITSKYAIINKRIAELTQTDGQQFYSNEDDMLQNLKDQLSDIRKNYFYADTKEDKFSFENADYQKQNEIKEYLRNVEKNPIYIECQKIIAEETINIQNNQKEWEKYQEKDWEIKIETDLFGNETQTKIDKNASKREYWARFIRNSETKIADQNHIIYVLKQYPDAVKQLAKWQIYNPNSEACDFFDADWMFNISLFDIVIGNPPYIKEYTNKSAFDGFREQSPYYMGKMDLWYGFACNGIDILKAHGVLCFIAQNNWTTSAGAKILRNKVVLDAKILQLVDFNNYMVFENADIQTMIMIFERDKDSNNYSFDYKCLPLKADKDDMISLLINRNEGEKNSPTYVINRPKFRNIALIFNDNENVLEKIAQGSVFLAENEIIQGIVPALDDYFILTNLNIFSEKELKYIKPYFTGIADRYVSYPIEKYLIYMSAKNFRENDLTNYPNFMAHFAPHRTELEQAKIKYETPNKPYFFVHRERNEMFFKKDEEKIVSQVRCEYPKFYYTKDDFYGSRALFFIKTKRWNMKFLIGVLNSNLIAFWLRNKSKKQGALLKLDKEPLLAIPLPPYSTTDARQVKIIDLVDKILTKKKQNPSEDTTYLEGKIDKLVYELYGLTDEEIAIVEGR